MAIAAVHLPLRGKAVAFNRRTRIKICKLGKHQLVIPYSLMPPNPAIGYNWEIDSVTMIMNKCLCPLRDSFMFLYVHMLIVYMITVCAHAHALTWGI